MKNVYVYFSLVFVLMLSACSKPQETLTGEAKQTIKTEVAQQFNQLIASINNMNAEAWSSFYSPDEFISAVVMTDVYKSQNVYVETIKKYFAGRTSQKAEPKEIDVTALTENLALLTSKENSEMTLKTAENLKVNHVFSMLWKKEKDGWKIIYAHESWTNENGK